MIKQALVASLHDAFAPSSAKRVTTCLASYLRTKGLPDVPTYEAAEGTVAHEIHEECLKTGVKAQAFVGKYYEVKEAGREFTVQVTHPMAAYVQESVDYCTIGGKQFVEERVDISRWTPIPDQSGTMDHASVFEDDFDETTLAVTDLKFGLGVKVYAEKNEQLALYAGGILDRLTKKYKITNVVIRVSQPRLNHYDVWAVTVEELLEFLEWIKHRFTLALDPNAPFQPSAEACQFCKLKPRCPALTDLASEIANGDFDDLTRERIDPKGQFNAPLFPPESGAISPEAMAELVECEPVIVGFLKAVKADMTKTLLARVDMPRFKLVEGRTFRKWIDESGAQQYLLEYKVPLQAFKKTPSSISPAEAEKLLPRAVRAGLRKFYVKPMGRPTLAPASDKRPAFDLTASHLFDDISDDELETEDEDL